MRRAALLVAVVLLVGATLASVPAAAQSDPAETVITIEVASNGDARWSVETRFELADEHDAAAFERLRSDFAAGDESAGGSVEVFEEVAERHSSRTGEESRITDVDRSTRVESEDGADVGVLELAFTWTNFATVEDDTIAVDRAFGSGWFGDLSDSQTLVVVPPEEYRVHTASPSTDIVAGALQWEGPQTFEPGEPSIQFVPVDERTANGPGPQQGIPWLYPAIGFVVLALAGSVLLAWRGGYLGSDQTESSDGGPPSPKPSGADATLASAETKDSDEAEQTDAELLSDEERVERLLEEHDGRMKQARIVEETRWSNAKVSQLLSAMADEGRVEKLRIGRENLISLPDGDEGQEP